MKHFIDEPMQELGTEQHDAMKKQDIIIQIANMIIDNQLSIYGAEEIFGGTMRYLRNLRISSDQ